MKTEREQEAAQFRAEGKQFAQETRAQADKERTVLLAEAGRQAQVQRGLGDEAAIKIYADAFKQDPEFYGFYRSMEAYRESLSGSDTTLILSPDSDFFKYFKESGGAK
jgi:membrane protease subunit HflC